MANLSALLCGLIFGLGLMLSGMTSAKKVLGFLDIAGRWDPSLAFVMLGAISVAACGFALARRRAASRPGRALPSPVNRDVDKRLVAGAALFGAGWGLVGICPGPALVIAGSGSPGGLLFLLCMLAGMGLYEASRRMARR